MVIFLMLVSGISWSITYLVSIYKGFKDKTYAMPFIALALNFSWEFVYTVSDFASRLPDSQKWVNLVWLLLDCVIVYTYFKFGKEEFKGPKKYFMSWSVIILMMSIVLQVVFRSGFSTFVVAGGVTTYLGAWYSAFIQNLVMSFLFISLRISRGNNRGQSLLIAGSKCLGTLAPTILFGVIYGNQVVLTLGIFIFLLDLIYMGLLSKGLKSLVFQ